MFKKRLIFFHRIIKALSESQNLANASANNQNQNVVNHRTVVKMQGNYPQPMSKSTFIKVLTKYVCFSFSVAVLACFVTFRTPLHIEKAIFVITTVTQKWDENMVYYHGILKLIAGM